MSFEKTFINHFKYSLFTLISAICIIAFIALFIIVLIYRIIFNNEFLYFFPIIFFVFMLIYIIWVCLPHKKNQIKIIEDDLTFIDDSKMNPFATKITFRLNIPLKIIYWEREKKFTLSEPEGKSSVLNTSGLMDSDRQELISIFTERKNIILIRK